MIVFSAIVPHPPMLIPQIGKENLAKLAKTDLSYKKLAEELKKISPDTIVIISPHGNKQPEVFNINISPEFETNFAELGDFFTKKTWPGNINLAARIREELAETNKVHLITDPLLDHGAAVPLFLLAENLDVKITPVYYSDLPKQDHWEFGEKLLAIFDQSQEKIAVIASGDLSHCLSVNAPVQYSPEGKKFDKKLTQLLLNAKFEDVLAIDSQLIASAAECGLNSIIILLGMQANKKNKPQLLSYEAPFGVGYLVMKL